MRAHSLLRSHRRTISSRKIEDAYTYAKAAVAKLEKPWTTELFLAYVLNQFKKYDEALAAVNKAASYPQGAKDAERL